MRLRRCSDFARKRKALPAHRPARAKSRSSGLLKLIVSESSASATARSAAVVDEQPGLFLDVIHDEFSAVVHLDPVAFLDTAPAAAAPISARTGAAHWPREREHPPGRTPLSDDHAEPELGLAVTDPTLTWNWLLHV